MDPEQEKVIRFLCEERGNCVVCANPGTGKTTTVLAAAERVPELRFLVLTYNNSLQTDTNRCVSARGLQNVEVCTYHQLVHARYDSAVADDWGIVNVLRKRGVRLTPASLAAREALRELRPFAAAPVAPEPFDVLVVDEAQDMCRLYFLVVAMVAADATRPFQIVVMGDVRQSVYSFRGADPRFLRFAESAWRGHPKLLHPDRWRSFAFTVTHRLTPAMCDFLNEGMDHHGEEGAVKLQPSSVAETARLPMVICADSTPQCVQFVMNTIRSLRERFQCPYHDIVVLCPSLHADPLAKQVMQELTLQSIPVFVGGGGGGGGKDVEERYDKCVRFYTFWSAKGLTVRFAIVLNPNNQYFLRQQREDDANDEDDEDDAAAARRVACPSPHFVTFSRAREMLVAVYAVDSGGRSGGGAQAFPPYLRREWFYGSDTSTVRLVGSKVNSLLESSTLSEDVAARKTVDKITGAKRRRQRGGAAETSATEIRTFSVAQLCSFLNSEFIASELGELYDWFERSIAVDENENENENENEKEIDAVSAPAYASTRFGNLEDVSALNERVMQYLGYDALMTGGAPICASVLENELRQLATKIAKDTRAEELNTRFRKTLDALRSGALRVADYVRAVTLMEAVRSGMYFRALHFRDADLNWIPDSAADWVKHVVARFCGGATETTSSTQTPLYARVKLEFAGGNGGDPERLPQTLRAAMNEGKKTVVVLHGTADVLLSSSSARALFIWKYKSTLQLEDFLQLLISCYIDRRSSSSRSSGHGATTTSYALVNLQTGEQFRLRADFVERACTAVEALIHNRVWPPRSAESKSNGDGDDAQFRAQYTLRVARTEDHYKKEDENEDEDEDEDE